MKRTEYRCGAMPLGKRGGVCGAKAREHNITQEAILSLSGVVFPQHSFVPQEIRSREDSV